MKCYIVYTVCFIYTFEVSKLFPCVSVGSNQCFQFSSLLYIVQWLPERHLACTNRAAITSKDFVLMDRVQSDH